MRIEDFNERLKQAILVGDGAMGSLLYESVGPQRCVDELNATHAEAVFRAHQAYIEAGAQIIETNTFGANRHKLAASRHGRSRGRAQSSRRENRARSARSRETRSPDRRLHRAARNRAARPRIAAPRKSSPSSKNKPARSKSAASIFSFSKLSATSKNCIAAIDAIRSFSRLPIVAQLTYSDEGTTFGGTRPQDAWEKLKGKNIQAIGANCTHRPAARCCRSCANSPARFKLPLSAMPNAGFPKRVGDRIVYPKSSPEYFALFAQEAAEIGARIIGGCCGTTPEHIHAIAEAVKKLRAAKPRLAGTMDAAQAAPWKFSSRPNVSAASPRASRKASSGKKFRPAKFVTSVEIDPPKGVTIDRIVEQVGSVMASAERGCDRHQQRHPGARRHGCAGPRRRARSARLSKPFRTSPRATPTSSACRPCCSAHGPSAACATFSRSPAILLRSAIIRKPAACTKSIRSAW